MAKILVVEDDDSQGRLIEKTLRRAGHKVVRAGNGAEALQLYDPATVDLILTDIVMPEKEGLELISALCHEHPYVRIIAMSGGGKFNASCYLPMARHMGAKKVLSKPFPNKLLLQTIAEVMSEPVTT